MTPRIEVLIDNLATGMLLVLALLWFTIGFRNSILTIVAIPFSFLTAIIFFPILAFGPATYVGTGAPAAPGGGGDVPAPVAPAAVAPAAVVSSGSGGGDGAGDGSMIAAATNTIKL